MLVDKPKGWTSHDVVAAVRRELKAKVKVGHGGTLDPFATGVLLVLIGKATRRFEEIKTWEKEYLLEVELGTATDTADRTGKVIKQMEVKPVSQEVLKSVLDSFAGGYVQQVPMYSAVKRDGKRLYQLARAGKKVKLPPRKVKIKEIELVKMEGRMIKIRVVCGSGTYMRQLAVDIGRRLGERLSLGGALPAHAKELRRIRVGKIRLPA